MTFGAYFLNNAISVQIDEMTPCMSLVQRGTVPSDGVVYYNGGTFPLLAIKPNGVYAAVSSAHKNGSNYFWTVDVTGGSGGSIDYYIFDRPPYAPSTSGWGMEFYDAGGHVTYTSKLPPFRLVGTAPGDYPAGKAYAFHQTAPRIERGTAIYDTIDVEDSRGNSTGEYTLVFRGYEHNECGWTVSGGSILTQNFPGAGGDYSTPATFLVINVTNL